MKQALSRSTNGINSVVNQIKRNAIDRQASGALGALQGPAAIAAVGAGLAAQPGSAINMALTDTLDTLNTLISRLKYFKFRSPLLDIFNTDI